MTRLDSSSRAGVESLAKQFATSFDVDKTNVLGQVSGVVATPSSGSNATPVHLSPVSTFIQGSKDGSFGYVVSSIAKHWGVLVGDSHKYLYHLVFQDEADVPTNANPDSLTGRVRTVKFDSTYWDPSRSTPSSTMYVGETRYSPFQLLEIGMTLRPSRY
jgi:hypothetical protein